MNLQPALQAGKLPQNYFTKLSPPLPNISKVPVLMIRNIKHDDINR